ncbi:MAG TPA: hypothetical protein VMV12_01885 [Candidatus Micrarchaeaceae archaeon]|nr:hypothetical protein [Candidatus Micrarchaeaceae archaeon]
MPGPVPKPEAQRRRRNVPSRPPVKVAAGPPGAELVWPPPDPAWPPLVVDAYDSLKVSGQATLFEPSDVATARLACEALSRILASERFGAVGFSAAMSLLDDLGATVGSRRRLRIELEKGAPPESPGLAAVRRRRAELRLPDPGHPRQDRGGPDRRPVDRARLHWPGEREPATERG